MSLDISEKIKKEKAYGKAAKEQVKVGKVPEKKGNDIPLYITIIILIIIIGVIIVISKIDTFKEDTYIEEIYNGYLIQGFKYPDFWSWQTYIQVPGLNRTHLIEMRHSPWDVENIIMDMAVVSDIHKASALFMTTDPDFNSKAVIGMIEVGRIVGERYNILNKPTINGLTRNPMGTVSETPIITCANATEERPVIYYKVGETTEITKDNQCIIVQGTSEDQIIMAADKLGYSLMGVIQ
jgi:hypothetical protein